MNKNLKYIFLNFPKIKPCCPATKDQLIPSYIQQALIKLTLIFSGYIFSNTHCNLLRLIVRSGLDVPTFATRRLHACHHARAPSGGRWNCGREMSGNFCLNADFHVTFSDLLHAVKLRHGTDVFTFPPKEGVLRNFFALKIRQLRPGVNPRTWVPKASTLLLGHRSRVLTI